MRPALTPRLNQSYELRPPWEQHLRYFPHRVRNGYNNALDTFADDAAILATHEERKIALL